jgi:hypothetical protein
MASLASFGFSTSITAGRREANEVERAAERKLYRSWSRKELIRAREAGATETTSLVESALESDANAAEMACCSPVTIPDATEAAM